uniref:Uncharacterized protein n=1 Tax=Strongyloides venezuelensis TaxID=75913 RepID=A0A0K0F525_STRVS
MERLHEDIYLIGKFTQSYGQTGQMERCNARFLKLAPAALQTTLRNELLNTPNNEHPSTQSEILTTQTTTIKRGRGRPRKVLPDNNKHSITDEIKMQPKKDRGRPKKIIAITNNTDASLKNQEPKRGRGKPKKH